MSIKLDKYTPLMMYLSPASIPQIVAHIQDYLVKHPILSVETIAEIIVQSLQEHPELINGEAIPISADSAQSIKAYIDALPALDTYTKAEINALLLGKQDTLTFDQAPTPGSSNPVTSSGIIAAMSALQSALETQISAKADRASTYTKTQVDTLLEDKADADDVYTKNTIDAKFLEVDTEIDNVNDALDEQSQQIDEKADIPVIVSVTVDTAGASMSATDQAKLTADMVMCWYTGNRSKLTSNLTITPAAGSATVTGTASSSTTFTIAFIHSANGGGIASVIPYETGKLRVDSPLPLYIYKDGNICICQSIYNTSPSNIPAGTNTEIATLPTGFRSNTTQFFPIYVNDNNGNFKTYANITIDYDHMYIRPQTELAADSFNFFTFVYLTL